MTTLGRGAVLVAAAGLFIAGCGGGEGDAGSGSAPASPDRPSVVVTTNILGDIVGEVAGGVADVHVLMPAGADPHSFGVSAADAERMEDADLIVANGLGLEEGVLNNVEAAADVGVTVLEVAPELDPLRYGDAAGASSGSFDPHIWTDPTRMIAAVDLIAEAIRPLPGVDPDVVDQAATDYAEELGEMDESMSERFEVIPPEDRRLVTNHHVFAYFAEHFDFEVIGAVLPSGTTLASPSASDLEDLADVLRETGVPAIFADSSDPARLAEVLASEAGVDVEVVSLFTESLGPAGSGAETYLEMLDTNADLIVAALVEG
ncbi:MAG: metal ABC transporter solute-binding protein, Zn/Mn family [Desertimonas sp.]